MAADLQSALNTLAPYLREGQSSIQLYRANFATPRDIPAMRFWTQSEYDRIQSGFASVDVATRTLAQAVSDVLTAVTALNSGAVVPEKGDKGDPGEPGEKGDPGDPGPPGDVTDLLDDNFIRVDATWSSQRINDQIEDRRRVRLYSSDVEDVDNSQSAAPDQVLGYDTGFWRPGYRTNFKDYIPGELYYPQNLVLINTSLFLATAETLEAPSLGSPDWTLIAQIGSGFSGGDIDGGSALAIYLPDQYVDGGDAATVFTAIGDPGDIDGGSATSIYTLPQQIDGGNAFG